MCIGAGSTPNRILAYGSKSGEPDKDLLISGGLLAFSIFEFINKPNLKFFWPIVGMAVSGLFLLSLIFGVCGILCSNNHCMVTHVILGEIKSRFNNTN